MRRRIADSVVVVTGASSGIGRATALRFAREGARVVVTARNEVGLAQLCQDCQECGARSCCVEADVTDPTALEAVAGRAIEEFGRIDVWVNCAAVTLVARFEDAPLEAFRRILDTNFFGYVYGVRAALPYMREQGCGVLINVSSQLDVTATPYESAYVASKFAIRGFSESIRQDLRDAGIAVVTVLPSSIDTPLLHHAANFSGRGVKPFEPVLSPERVARAIVRAARAPKHDVVVGHSGRLLRALHHVSPHQHDVLARRKVEAERFVDQPAPESMGNLFSPAPPFGVTGGWRRPRRLLRTLALAGLVTAPLGALALTSRRIRALAR